MWSKLAYVSGLLDWSITLIYYIDDINDIDANWTWLLGYHNYSIRLVKYMTKDGK